jgi:hypothetical protein
MSEAATVGNTARLILTMSERTAGLAAGLAEGIDPKQASTMPTVDGKTVNCNHPTFIFGHLAIYPQMILGALGLEPGDAAMPANYMELFQMGAECEHDPKCSKYPAFEEVLANFQKAHKAVHERLATLDDETLSKPITGKDYERAAEFFGTTDAMALFMLHDHYMFHLGQLSTWRRCFGLGSVMG